MANTSIFAAFERMWQHILSKLGNKSDVGHNHDNMYYTEAEVDTKVSDLNTLISSNLQAAKTYIDNKTSNLASTSSVDNKISDHNTSNAAHNDIRVLITDLTTKLNNFLDVDDTTTDQLSEVITLINNNKGTLESLTTNKVNVSDIVDNLTTASKNKVLSANQGVTIKALIDALQNELDGKAPTVHNHDDRYYTKTEIDNIEFVTVDSINTVCNTPTLTFEIEEIYYLVEEGMTWEEWCDSGYNTDGFYIDSNEYVYNGNLWVWNNGDQYARAEHKSKIIDVSQIYCLKTFYDVFPS